MTKILLFGAGKSATCLIRYLVRETASRGWELVVAESNLSLAQSKVGTAPHAKAVAIQVENEPERDHLIQDAAIVISLLPPALHYLVAVSCVKWGKDLLTASYLDESIKALEPAIREKGLLFIGEMGLDPGIDHMSAMQLIHRIKANNGQILSFRSHTGGLVAPESDNNPWHYKISWNPRNVVMAGSAGAQYKENGQVIGSSYQQLFEACGEVKIEGLHQPLSWYPNRDSLSYIPLYGLEEADTFIRTTLRYPDFCRGWAPIVRAGLTNDQAPLPSPHLTDNQTPPSGTANLTASSPLPDSGQLPATGSQSGTSHLPATGSLPSPRLTDNQTPPSGTVNLAASSPLPDSGQLPATGSQSGTSHLPATGSLPAPRLADNQTPPSGTANLTASSPLPDSGHLPVTGSQSGASHLSFQASASQSGTNPAIQTTASQSGTNPPIQTTASPSDTGHSTAQAGDSSSTLTPAPGLSFSAWSAPILPFVDAANRDLLTFLGLFDETPVPSQARVSADVLQYLLETRLAMGPHDKDMIVMLHEITYLIDGKQQEETSSLIVIGTDPLETAMAKTVGLPLGIAAKLILEGKMQRLTGLHIPVLPEIYEPVLKELAKEGIRFEERGAN